MKNAMKKIMSLVLVAMILVSALPFAASAAGATFTVNLNGDLKLAESPTSRDSISSEECLSICGVNGTDYDVNVAYDAVGVQNNQALTAGQSVALEGTINIWVWAEPKATTPPTTEAPTEPSVPDGVTGSEETGYHKISGTVTLRVQIKGTSNIKDFPIKGSLAADGKVTLSEVKTLVKANYNAIDTDTGIIYDGIYIDSNVYSLWNSYIHNKNYSTVDGLYEAAFKNNDVRLTVVIDNVKPNTTSNADSTNPKTGDAIFAPAMVLGLSASALVVLYYLNKKRAF